MSSSAVLRNVSSVLSSDGTHPTLQLVKDDVVLETLRIIPAEQQHRSFIIGTWVKSYESQARKQGIPKDVYAKHEPPIAESRWQDCKVLTDDDGYTVHAWVCGGDGDLYHCYVVPELRKMRIATRLIEHATGGLKFYARPWPYAAHARTNPYLLRAK